MIPERMRAMVLTGHGDLDQLMYHDDWPVPVAEAGEALIKVHACGLNNTDVNTRTGWYSRASEEPTTGGSLKDARDEDAGWGGSGLSFPRIQGADVCGTVVRCDSDSTLVGKRVLVDTWLRDWDEPLNLDRTGYLGSESDGGFADYVAVDVRNVHPVSSNLGDAELATFATAFVTAENMLNRAAVKKDDLVLITGASGGVGSALIQLAHRRGAQTIALASEAKHAELAALGSLAVLPRSPEDLAGALRKVAGRDAVDVVADVVGGSDWGKWIDVIARGGRYTCAGAIAGPVVSFDLRPFYLHDLTFTGATVVPPGTFADLVTYIERKEIKPLLAGSWPLEQLHDAQRAFIDKTHIGNFVVTMSSSG